MSYDVPFSVFIFSALRTAAIKVSALQGFAINSAAPHIRQRLLDKGLASAVAGGARWL
jgi:hypothetical protein